MSWQVTLTGPVLPSLTQDIAKAPRTQLRVPGSYLGIESMPHMF